MSWYALAIQNKWRQDGPSLESSSYLNVSLRYPGPLDPWTLGLLDLFPLPTPPHTSPYILILSVPPTLLLWYGLVMGGGVVTFDNETPHISS